MMNAPLNTRPQRSQHSMPSWPPCAPNNRSITMIITIIAVIILARILGPITRTVDQDAEYEAQHRKSTYGDAK